MFGIAQRTGGLWWMVLSIAACVAGVAICVSLILSQDALPHVLDRIGIGVSPDTTSSSVTEQHPVDRFVGVHHGSGGKVVTAHDPEHLSAQAFPVVEEKGPGPAPVRPELADKVAEEEAVLNPESGLTQNAEALSTSASPRGSAPGREGLRRVAAEASAAVTKNARAPTNAGPDVGRGEGGTAVATASPISRMPEPDVEAIPEPDPMIEVSVGDTGRAPEIGKPVVDFIIGGSHSDPRRRMVGWNIVTEGWAAFIRKRVDAYLEIGTTRVILHNPFGILPGEPMQLDQYLNALEQPGLRMLTVGFDRAWKPVTDRGVEVIAYIGCPRLDTDATRIDEEEGRAAGLAFALRCLQPALDAGMSIGLDAAAPADGDSLTWDLANHLRSEGVKVYVEARPHAEMSHWFDFPVICIDRFWRRSDPDLHSDAQGAANHLLTGEILRMIIQYQIPADWESTEAGYIQQLSRTVQSHGHTPIVLAGSKFPPEQVVELHFPPSIPAYE